MPRVNYQAPSTVDEAVKLLAGASGVAKVLAGGTDLLVQLKSGRVKPELIVDTKRIPGLIGIREEGDAWVVGAATPGVMLSEHKQLEHAFPGIVEGVDLIGSMQIQGRCSIAGNLCNASPAADSVPPVIAARATAVLAGPNGKREVPVEQIVTGPGQTSLQKGEAEGAAVRRLSALYPAHRDGHRRGRLRRQRHARRQWHLHRCARGAGRRRPDAGRRRRCGKSPHWPQARRRHLKKPRRRRAARLQADQRQARHDRIPHQGRRCAGPPGGRHCL